MDSYTTDRKSDELSGEGRGVAKELHSDNNSHIPGSHEMMSFTDIGGHSFLCTSETVARILNQLTRLFVLPFSWEYSREKSPRATQWSERAGDGEHLTFAEPATASQR